MTTPAALALALFLAAPVVALGQDTHAHVTPEGESLEALRLADLQAEALERNPELLAMRAMAEAVAAQVSEKGTLPDPMVMVGAMNLGLPELDAGMPSSMLPSIQLSQTFPFFGKLGIREEIAAAEGEGARIAVTEAEWRLRARVAEHFHNLHALDQRLAVHRRTLSLLRDFQSVARTLYASGSGRQGDVIRADVEVARMEAEIRRLESVRASRAASLNAILGRPGDTPVGATESVPLPDGLPGPDTLLAWAAESRPALEAGSVRVEQAVKGVELAEKDFWPDFTVAAQYGRRGGDQPRSMGGLSVGASIPVFRGSRQRPRLEAARALERQARAGLDGARASVDAELRTVLADLDRDRSLMALYRDEILPAAEANVSSSLASYRVGAVDFPTLVDAQLAVDRFEQEYHQLAADYGTGIALLEAVVGRPMERGDTLSSAFMPENP